MKGKDIEQIPEFRLAASTGQTLSRESFHGKVPVVSVFLSDLESHGDQEIEEEIGRRLREIGETRSQILGVVKTTARAVRDHADQRGVKFPILADASGSMRRDFAVEPTERQVVISDKDGKLIERFGYDPTNDDASAVVDRVLETLRRL